MARPRRPGAWLLAFAAVLAVGLSLLAWRTGWAERRLVALVAHAISEATGERATLAGVEVRWDERELALQGLVLSHRSADPARDGAPIAVIPAVRAQLGRDGALPRLRRLHLVSPQVHLHLDADGLRELRGLSGSAAADAAPASAFPWDELWISDAGLRVDGPELGVAVQGLDFLPAGAPGRSRLAVRALEVQVGSVTEQARHVFIDEVQVSPDRLVIPALSVQTPHLRVDGHAAVLAQGDLAGDLSLSLDLALFRPASGPEAWWDGVVSADVAVSGRTDAPVLDLALLGEGVQEVRADPSIPALVIGDFTAQLHFSGRTLEIERLRTTWGGGPVELQGVVDPYSTGFGLGLVGEGVHLDRALVQAGTVPVSWCDFDADLELQVAGTFSPFRMLGSLDLAARNLRVVDGDPGAPGTSTVLDIPLVRLEGAVDVDTVALRIDAQRLSTARSAGRAAATIGFTPNLLDIRLDFPRLALDELAPLGGLGLQGQAHLVGRLVGPADALRGQGRVTATDFGIGGQRFAARLDSPLELPRIDLLRFDGLEAQERDTRLTGAVSVDLARPGPWLDLSLRTDGGRLQDLVGLFVDIPGLDAGVDAALRLEGAWPALDGGAEVALTGVDLFGERFPAGAGQATIRKGVVWIDPLEVSRADGSEGLLLRGSVGPAYALNLDLQGAGLRAETSDLLRESGLRADVDLVAQVGGTLFAPRPAGRLALRDAAWGDGWLGDGTVYLEPEGDTLVAAALLGEDGLTIDARLGLLPPYAWSAETRFAGLRLDRFVPRAVDGAPVRIVVAGDARAEGALDGSAPPRVRASVSGEAAWRDQRLITPVPWVWEQDGSAFRFSGVGLRGGRTDFLLSGRRASEGDIAVDGEGAVDLALLGAMVPGVQEAQGVAQVRFTASGVGGAVSPRVAVDLREARVVGDWFPVPFEGIDARLVGGPGGYTVESARGRVGGGDFTGAGRIDAAGWLPTRFALDAEVSDARIQYISDLPPGLGDASLSLDGPVDDLLLSGGVRVEDMLFGERIAWEEAVLELAGGVLAGSAEEEAGRYFALDLAVDAPGTIRIRNNLGDFSAAADLRIVGDTARPGVLGKVVVAPGGRAYLKERQFEIVRGEIRFLEPYTFDPDLDLALTTQVRTREQEVQVDVRVVGPYSDWRTESRSDPALPQADINALILFGMTREELQRYGGAAAALALEGGDLLASRFGLVDSLGEGIARVDLLRPERIDLVSGVSERGSGTISSELRLLAEKDLGWSTLVFEQNLSRLSDTWLALEKRLANRLFLRTTWAREQVGRNLETGGAWGLEFNVRWELD